MFEVNAEQFHGPLDLLLELTTTKKLDLSDISLAKITDQYLSYLGKLDKLPLDDLANFLVVASRLLLIKSKMILPALELSPDEEGEIEDLKKQLQIYQKFQELAKKIKQLELADQALYSREGLIDLKTIFLPPIKLKISDLNLAFKKAFSEINLWHSGLPEKNLKLKVSLSQKIRQLQLIIARRGQITFQQINQKANSKPEMIVNFLALLQLVKRRIVFIDQKKTCGEIKINKT